MIRLAGHIARMKEMSFAYKIVFQYHRGVFYSEEQALDLRATLRSILENWSLIWIHLSPDRLGRQAFVEHGN